MRFRADERGQMLVLTALSLAALLGFLALAVDVGLLFRAKRQVQTAADAGAIAGAIEYSENGPTNVASMAGTAVTNNGVTLSYTPSLNTGCPSTTQNCAIVNTSGITGYHNQPGYVQVIAAQPTPTFFMGMFARTSATVSASAIAGIAPNPACIIALDPSGSKSFWVKGNSNINASQCGIQVDSSSSSAVCVQGSSTIESPYLKIDGGQSTSGQCNKVPGTPVYGGSGTSADPFAGITTPTPANCTSTSLATTITALSQLPSFTAGTILANNIYCFQNNVTFGTNGTNLYMPPGIYLFENGVNFASGSNVFFGTAQSAPNTINDLGATLEIYGGSFNDQNGNLSIYAPSDKTNAILNGIALYQPAANTTATCQDPSLKATPCLQAQFGSSSATPPAGELVGYIYAPTSTVYLQDQGGGIQATGVVSYDFYNNSQLTITQSYNFYNPSTTPLSSVALVE